MAFFQRTFTSISEFRYVDVVRTLVRTAIFRKLNEVNSESSTEFRDIDAVWVERKLRSYSLRVLASLGTFLKKKQGSLRGESIPNTRQSIISDRSNRI